MAKLRKETQNGDCWNIEALYPTLTEWQKSFQTLVPNTEKGPLWPGIAKYQHRLGESPETLKAALEELLDYDRKISKLYVYAHLRHDEELTIEDNKVAFNKVLSAIHAFSQETAWFQPELLSLSDERLNELVTSPILADYRFHLEKLLRVKKHTLSKEKEELIALAGKAFQTPSKAFSAVNDADFKFGMVKDSNGQENELTHATYGVYIRSPDRTLRENAFKKIQGQYESYENTLCELLTGVVEGHVFNAKARQFSSSLEAALYPKNIDVSVYHALITAVNEESGALHKYSKLREKVLNIGPLHLYDMQVPLVPHMDIRMTYPEAEDIIIESVAPLGTEYQSLLKAGLKEQRWVDRYENQNKRSGAYSSGCYDSMPYILMNFQGQMRDVFTLAHEAGHSMHSLLSQRHQPYHYSDYPIFLAEVASTFNEELLMQKLLERAKTKEEKIYLINQKVDDIRATLFRQTMFAEFELFIHEMAEKNEPLTPRLLKEFYRNLNRKYYGENIILDEVSDIEWARIPHFYYNFYVYQYATGISAALALADRVLKGGDKERNEYLSFLKAGSSRYPIETLQLAGVDMRTPAPVKAAIQKFSSLVDELEKLC